MARMQWKPREQMTPFAQLLFDYLREHWPMTIPELAQQTGVSAQTIYDYFQRDVLPRASTLDLIAAGTGMQRKPLYDAAGVAMPSEVPWRELAEQVEREERLPKDARNELVGRIRELQARYGADQQEPTSASAVLVIGDKDDERQYAIGVDTDGSGQLRDIEGLNESKTHPKVAAGA